MSTDLVWELVKKHNSFLLKRDGVLFSREVGNVTNLHSYKHSGLANSKAIDVSALPNGGVSLGFKRGGHVAAHHPARAFSRTNMAKVDLTRAARKVGNAIKKNTRARFYRRDLTNAALARWTLLHRALRRSAGQLPKATVGPRRFTRAAAAASHKKKAVKK